MKGIFALFVLLLLVSFAVWKTLPESAPAGKTPLVWVSDDNPLREAQITQFNALNPDINLILDPANTGMEKVIVQSLGGVGPDLFDCRDANQLSAYVKSGIAWDATDELARLGIDVQRDVWSAMHPTAIREGRVYGVPTNVAANALWLNKEIFEKSKVPLPRGPWTWEQFIPVAQRLTLRDRSGRVTQFGFLCDWWNWGHFLIGYGASIFSADGTRCTIDSAQAVAAIQMMHDLVYKYKVTPSPVEEAGMASTGGWGSGSINLFGAKRAAMALGGRWWLANLRRPEFEDLELGIVESPCGTVRAFGSVGRATVINKNSLHRAQALGFLVYLSQAPYNDLINEQADGIAAFKKYSTGVVYEYNPKFPKEDYNVEWRRITSLAVPMGTSIFVNGLVSQRIIERQLDLVRIDAKGVGDALRQAAREVNTEIQKTLDADPRLRARWLRLRKQGQPSSRH